MSKLRSVIGAIGTAAVAVVLLVLLVTLVQSRSPQVSSPGGAGPLASAAGPTAATPSADGATDISLAPAQPAQAPSSDCLSYVTSYDRATITLDLVTRISTGVVDATVAEVGPARWRTETETPPTERHDLTGDRVMRLVRLSVGQDLSQRGVSGSIVVWVPGGVIGCSTFQVGGYPVDLRVGDRFVFFLNSTTAPITTLKGVSRVMEMWPIEGSAATSPDLGAVTLADIQATAARDLSP